VSDAEPELEHGDEHQVTPLELFFDLVFVFAITQVTTLLARDPTWVGVLRGMLVLAALWWAWSVYAWLTSAMDVDEGGVRLTMLAAMAAMLVVALAVPGAFGGEAVLFGVAYLLVRPSSPSSSPPSSVATIPTAAARCSGSRRPRSSAPRCSCWPASSRATSASRCGCSRLPSTTSAPS
jgi:hypothetical protein